MLGITKKLKVISIDEQHYTAQNNDPLIAFIVFKDESIPDWTEMENVKKTRWHPFLEPYLQASLKTSLDRILSHSQDSKPISFFMQAPFRKRVEIAIALLERDKFLRRIKIDRIISNIFTG